MAETDDQRAQGPGAESARAAKPPRTPDHQAQGGRGPRPQLLRGARARATPRDGRALDRGRRGRHRPATGSCAAASEIAAFFRELFAALPDLETTVDAGGGAPRTRPPSSGGWRAHFTGAPFQGIEPTGRRIDMRGLDLLEIEDGEIRRATPPTTTARSSRAQVGLLPAQDSGAERAMKGAFNAVTKARCAPRAATRRQRGRRA